MNKKNKLLLLIVIFLILVLICKAMLSFKTINYNIGENKISEIYEDGKYYIEIKTKKHIYPIRVFNSINNKRKILKKLYIYSDKSIECVLPIINSTIYSDFICYKDGIIYNYHDIIGENKKLDQYIEKIEEYNINDFKNENGKEKQIGIIKYNIFKGFNHKIAITTYKGLIINDMELNIFKKDIYNNRISTFINNYYLIADYENEYSFNYFYLINLKTNEISKIKSKDEISYDSYIQGIVSNKVYLYDRNNEIQYEIDIKNRKINISSDGDHIKYYSNNKWEKLNKVKANKEIYFNYESLDNRFPDYDYVKSIDNYYYLFKKDGISYKVYKVDKSRIEVYKYICEVPTTNISFKDDYLYYVYKNKLYYYGDNLGLKVLLENPELEFNNTIKYYIY